MLRNFYTNEEAMEFIVDVISSPSHISFIYKRLIFNEDATISLFTSKKEEEKYAKEKGFPIPVLNEKNEDGNTKIG